MMKKNKLYTVNRFNKPMFMPRENLFAIGGNVVGSLAATNPSDFWGVNSSVNKPTQLSSTGLNLANLQAQNSAMSQYLQNYGSDAMSNPLSFKEAFSSSGLKSGLKAGAGAAIGAGAGLIGGLAGDAIGGGLQSGAGSAISGIGSTVGSAIGSVNPILGAAVSVGSSLLGGLTNRMFGSKINEENVALVKQKAAELSKQGNIAAGSQTNADILSNWGSADLGFGFNKSFIGEDGWFSSAASEKYEEIKRLHEAAKRSAIHGLSTGVRNADTNTDNDVLASYHAFGGPLTTNIFGKGGKKSNRRKFSKKISTEAGFTPEEVTAWEKAMRPSYMTERGGTYGGGSFDGSGSTSRWTPAYKPNNTQNFNEAFDEAKAAGAETFMFGDREYNTVSEGNPIREYNNRYVGAGRTPKIVRERGVYGIDYGPIGGPLSKVPILFHSYGGPLEQYNSSDMGAIGYNLTSDYLDTKRKNSDNKNQMTNLFMGTPKTMFAFGGDLQTHGGDFGTGLTHVNAGKSHEENPYDGVQMGVDSEGTPNLVEEGEVIYNDYVFSNRIKVPDEAKKWLGIKGKDLTFADASKQLEKEIKERPNDPVSRAGFNAQIERLEDEQEFAKRCSSYSKGEIYDVDDTELALLDYNGYEYERL